VKSDAVVLQRKIIGVLIRAAREKSRRTIKEAAQRLGVTPARFRQYEWGSREISLPELEQLALFFQMPLSFFMNAESSVEIPEPRAPSQEEMRARRAALGVKLKQARLAAGKSKEECAQIIDRTPATIGRYERGTSDVPITELERLAEFLQVNLYYFVQDKLNEDASGLLDLEKLSRLPKEVRAFVLDPDHMPYVRMAMKFSDLPTNRLKELGEILLIVR
jgi:transcriptional regulator with XRE-family HTH domain